ncbi:MAG: cation diffusion facilitator family transporter [Anaerolineae bacterium]|jgi:cation diffusion facilitator family transporter|nr:cation diffusion facilitator family transporter [Anaerolineae bacterium]
MAHSQNNRSTLKRYAWLSIAAALVTMGLKAGAYLLTGSVGLLSDALESLVNLAGAIMVLSMLNVAARPADDNHTYGHSKAEYFSSGFEGSLILIAAGSIVYTAVKRLIDSQPLEQLGIGLLVLFLASMVNLGVSLILKRAGKRHNAVSLTANSHHLMTDVWTSAGVLIGVGAVAITGWQPLDSIVAILAAINILWTGYTIIRDSAYGLMDTALLQEDLDQIDMVLDRYKCQGVEFHAVRTRQSGSSKFINMHVLVPNEWTVEHGHALLNQIENELKERLPNTNIFTHLEPLHDPTSYTDIEVC